MVYLHKETNQKTGTMTTLETATRINTEMKESTTSRLAEIKEMFEMGLITPKERFELDHEAKRNLTSYFTFSK